MTRHRARAASAVPSRRMALRVPPTARAPRQLLGVDLSRKPTSVQTAEVGASSPVVRVWTKDRLPPQSRAYRSRALADDGLRVDGLARVATLRALEPQVLAQGRAFVFGAEQAARLHSGITRSTKSSIPP